MIRVADIRLEWDRIKDAVASICHAGQDRPEDVYAACKFGHASLLVTDDAFAICFVETNKNTGIKQMMIWKAHGDIYGAMERHQPELDAMAKEQGCTSILIGSPRAAWRKIAGWTEELTYYRRAI